jgi:WD40 repeat protein
LYTFREYFGRVASVSFSPDGKRLATGDLDTVRVFDLATGKVLWKAPGHRELLRVAYSPDGSMVAVGGKSLTVSLYDGKTGEAIRELVGFNGEGGTGWHFAWTPDSTGIVSPVCLMPVLPLGRNPNIRPLPVGGPGGEGDGKYRLVLWDVKTGDRVRQIGPESQDWNQTVAVAPDGTHAAVGDSRTVLVELKTGKTKWTAATAGVNGLAFAADDTLYAGTVCLDAGTGKKKSELKADAKQLRVVTVPPKGKVVLTASQYDNTVVVWPQK